MDLRLFTCAERRAIERPVQPTPQRAGLPRNVCVFRIVRLCIQCIFAEQQRLAVHHVQYDPFDRFLAIGRVVVLLVGAKRDDIALLYRLLLDVSAPCANSVHVIVSESRDRLRFCCAAILADERLFAGFGAGRRDRCVDNEGVRRLFKHGICFQRLSAERADAVRRIAGRNAGRREFARKSGLMLASARQIGEHRRHVADIRHSVAVDVESVQLPGARRDRGNKQRRTDNEQYNGRADKEFSLFHNAFSSVLVQKTTKAHPEGVFSAEYADFTVFQKRRIPLLACLL